MDFVFKKIDGLLKKIPPHIKDIIQKVAIAMIAFIALIAVVMGITQGANDARPGGFDLAKDIQETFYLQKIRNENRNRIALREDYNYDFDEKLDEAAIDARFQKLTEDKMDRIIGEPDDVLQKDNPLAEKADDRHYLSDSALPLTRMPHKLSREEGISTENDLIPMEEKSRGETVSPEKNANPLPPENRNNLPASRPSVTPPSLPIPPSAPATEERPSSANGNDMPFLD